MLNCKIINQPCRRIKELPSGSKCSGCHGCVIWHRVNRHGGDPNDFIFHRYPAFKKEHNCAACGLDVGRCYYSLTNRTEQLCYKCAKQPNPNY